MYGMGLIGGFCHLYIGQEAVVVGVQAALTDVDSVITAYRDHGHMLACAWTRAASWPSSPARRGGYAKGKGGSMHMFSKEKNFYGGHGIVGADVSLGTGLAFAHRYRDDGGICATYMGDGAVNQGQVSESFNMAALWSLPVLYIIENNRYGMGTSSSARRPARTLFSRGGAYDIPGEQVDGMDVVAVTTAAERAVAHVRGGKGPMILEMLTYRYRGHSMSDPAKYRSKEEVQKIRMEKDPIETLKRRILEGEHADAAVLKEIDREVKRIVTTAAEFAQESPEPDPSELGTDVLLEA